MTPSTERATEELADALNRHDIRRVLIIVSGLEKFGGPSLIAADMACTLRSFGVSVQVAGWAVNADYVRQVPGLEDAVALGSDPRPVRGGAFDLVITHGWMTSSFALLECGIRFRYLVLCSFSAFMDGEAIFGLEGKADALLFAAKRIGEVQEPSLVSCPAPRINYRNAVTRLWFRSEARPAKLNRICIVTNHPCAEVRALLDLLPAVGVEPTLIGRGGTPRLIEPDLIDQFDAVVTIGHTAQKALARGVPVFCYDHFGGPGWITRDNIDAAEADTFSGRWTSQRTAQQLLDEIVGGHPAALEAAPSLRSLARNRYDIEERLSALIGSFRHRDDFRDCGGPEHWNYRRILHFAMRPISARTPFPHGYMLSPQTRQGMAALRIELSGDARLLDVSLTEHNECVFFGALGAQFTGRLRLRLYGHHPASQVEAVSESGEVQTLRLKAALTKSNDKKTFPITVLSGRLALKIREGTKALTLRVTQPDDSPSSLQGNLDFATLSILC
ncbi:MULTISPECIES: hypothetical protein [Roseomonadaceae]|uniref:Glycosyltransferase n=1 Tax=Falsiroseomonas oleicola TaxID=2801474 RepID=A0ABS6HB60_9PROT|nr:hypothetical protein [Roseomonas oleicola]MBU8545972.1 hypothetical protein [Roseomonas oleicola]